MRWVSRGLKLRYLRGESRIVKKFLLIPRKFDDETRWLEYAYILESVRDVSSISERSPNFKWRELAFSDEGMYIANFNIATGESSVVITNEVSDTWEVSPSCEECE